jgi:imidazole glycerol-phosphate synthase subunit HisH
MSEPGPPTMSTGRPRPRVAIIDYEAGNLFSVQHACVEVGLDPIITSDPAVLAACAAAILPGVGAFGAAMANLQRLGLAAAIGDFVASGRPLLGVCLGLQLLLSQSEEFGRHEGLGIVPGKVVRFANRDAAGQLVRVPQIGWNQVFPPAGQSWDQTPLSGVNPGEYVYFVHSFYVVPDRPSDVLCVAEYGGQPYCAGIRRGNLLALQFHPEKSAHQGLRIYRQWAESIR